MSRFGKFVVVVSVLWFVPCTVHAIHRRSGVLELISFFFTVIFLAVVVSSIVSIFIEWRQRRWASLLPLTVCVLSIVLSDMTVTAIRHLIFVQSLPSYEAVVQQMESGKISVSTNMNLIPEAIPQARFAYAVFARKDTNGALLVEFVTEGGFPVKHSGYLYCSSDTNAPDSWKDSRWPIRHEEKPHWFYVSD